MPLIYLVQHGDAAGQAFRSLVWARVAERASACRASSSWPAATARSAWRCSERRNAAAGLPACRPACGRRHFGDGAPEPAQWLLQLGIGAAEYLAGVLCAVQQRRRP
jgi:hypothetical protein